MNNLFAGGDLTVIVYACSWRSHPFSSLKACKKRLWCSQTLSCNTYKISKINFLPCFKKEKTEDAGLSMKGILGGKEHT